MQRPISSISRGGFRFLVQFLFFALAAWSLASCKTFATVRQPLSNNLDRIVKPGDRIRLQLVNGMEIESIQVREVWPDSVRMGNDLGAVRSNQIKHLEVMEVDGVVTAVSIILLIPLVLFGIWALGGGQVM